MQALKAAILRLEGDKEQPNETKLVFNALTHLLNVGIPFAVFQKTQTKAWNIHAKALLDFMHATWFVGPAVGGRFETLPAVDATFELEFGADGTQGINL